MTRTPLSKSKVKGQGYQVTLLTAALTREAGAAATVRSYRAWETTATLRLLGSARDAVAPTGGEEGRGHIVSPCALKSAEFSTEPFKNKNVNVFSRVTV